VPFDIAPGDLTMIFEHVGSFFKDKRYNRMLRAPVTGRAYTLSGFTFYTRRGLLSGSSGWF
jgi:hypothetical protein